MAPKDVAPALSPVAEEACVGRSSAMRLVMQAVTHVASQPVNVLICGEPGTGRELIARVIHERGRPADRPFVKVDCSRAALDDLETELFGIPVKGSHERRVERRAFERITRSGRLYQANGGTLFLENVIELPRRVQMRLARLLRDQEAVIHHEQEHVGFNARVITAAESSFDRAVSDGRLWADLYSRLAGFRIEVPPLRSRREDIPALAEHFVKIICHGASVPCKALSESAQSILSALPWRGNTIELRALLEGLVMRVPGPTIDLNDVLANVQLDGHASRLTVGGPLREARARFEREYIAAVLKQHQGRIPDAARTLGIQRTNLYRKMKQLKVHLGPPSGGRHKGNPKTVS
jgi:two-component system nitrogen regulation response regulator NtrX